MRTLFGDWSSDTGPFFLLLMKEGERALSFLISLCDMALSFRRLQSSRIACDIEYEEKEFVQIVEWRRALRRDSSSGVKLESSAGLNVAEDDCGKFLTREESVAVSWFRLCLTSVVFKIGMSP